MALQATMETKPHVPSGPARAGGRRRRSGWYWTPQLITDWGDDYEMSEEFGNSLARAGDRIAGFVYGAGLLAAAWALWTLL